MIRKTRTPVMAFITTVTTTILLAGCVVHIEAKDGNRDIQQDYTSLNKRVSVPPGAHVNEISSFNGRVDVADDITADNISTVNGKIEVSDNVTARAISTVNGKITIGSNAKVKDSVETVNGKIEIGHGSSVGRNVSTVNGKIDLTQVTVGRDVETVNGNIELRAATVVKGDIIMGSSDNNHNHGYYQKRPLVLRIDSSSTVEGNIIIYRDIEFDFKDESLRSKIINRAQEH